MQQLTFKSPEDALLFFEYLLAEEDFEELGSFCDVRCRTEVYYAYDYREQKKVCLQGNVIASFYFPMGIEFTTSFSLDFGEGNLI